MDEGGGDDHGREGLDDGRYAEISSDGVLERPKSHIRLRMIHCIFSLYRSTSRQGDDLADSKLKICE
jgi:hypothetical protein